MGKWRRRLLWLLAGAFGVGALCAVLLAIAIVGSPPLPRESAEMMEGLLAAGSEPTPFSAVLPDREWDTVCYLDPYDLPSRRLPFHLSEDLRNFSFQPSHRWIDEHENGLAFIDRRARMVHVFIVKKLPPTQGIYRIEGPRCLERESAFFKVALVHGLNFSANHLFFIEQVGSPGTSTPD